MKSIIAQSEQEIPAKWARRATLGAPPGIPAVTAFAVILLVMTLVCAAPRETISRVHKMLASVVVSVGAVMMVGAIFGLLRDWIPSLVIVGIIATVRHAMSSRPS
jgi:hypothetical protein